MEAVPGGGFARRVVFVRRFSTQGIPKVQPLGSNKIVKVVPS
jgi:hypothetical protein